MKRDNIDYDFAVSKINSQLSLEEKLKYANFIIDNNSSVDNTINQIKNILKQFKKANFLNKSLDIFVLSK